MEWLCNKDLKNACKALGVSELKTYQMPNTNKSSCAMCGQMADILVDVIIYNCHPLRQDDLFLTR